jgi:GntR family transcriptional regulator
MISRFEPDPDAPGYLYVQVADHIAARIKSGDLRLKGRLRGERELAEEYRVAFGTMRRAIAELRERGLVATYRGKGTYVVKKP